MKLAIVQMSDLHITSENDYIVKSSITLARASAQILNECDKAVFVVTGDIVDKGNVSNYQWAKKMFKDFQDEIEKEAKIANWDYIIVPGNHDLDFSMDVPFRNMVIKDTLEHGAISRKEFEDEALKPQDAFWKFYSELTSCEYSNRISYEKKISINQHSSLVFHCYNTALLSTIDEQPQNLLMPENNFLEYNDSHKERNDIVISVFHHKTGWLTTRGERNNRHQFSEHIQKQSHILMCGHEHQHERKQISDLDNKDSVLYLEGDSLQQGEEQSFTIIVFDENDLANIDLYNFVVDAKNDKCLLTDEKKLTITRHEHSFAFSNSFYEQLHSIDAPIKHPRKSPLLLDDVFVYPDLEPLNGNVDDDRVYTYIDSKELFSYNDATKVIILEGESQCGKTALVKMLIYQCYHRSIYPILLHGKDICNIKIKPLLSKAYNSQYDISLKSYQDYCTIERQKRIVFIDNLDKSSLNTLGVKEVISSLLNTYDKIIITTSESIDIRGIISTGTDKMDIITYSVHALGYLKRNALIEKWIMLGSDIYCSDRNKMAEAVKTAYDQITNILGKQFLPSNPIFLLTLLQNIDTGVDTFDVSPTSYAALYQSLLFASLIRAGVHQNNLDGYSMFLSELAYKMYEKKVSLFSEVEMANAVNYNEFYDEYSKERNVVAKKDVILSKLKDAAIIKEQEDKVYQFSYKYLFFYLTALKLSRIINTKEGQNELNKLCDALHKENNANILLFLAYLDKSDILLDEIKFTSWLPFEKLEPITLNADDKLYGRLADLVNSLKQDVLREGIDYKKERYRRLAAHDKEDMAIRKASAAEALPDNEEFEQNQDLIDFRNSLFVTQIMGQIVKNQRDTLRKEELTGLIEDAYNATFRSLSFITQIIEDDRKSFIEEITKNPNLIKGTDEKKIQERLNRLLQMVLMKFCLFSFARLSLSVGTSGVGMPEIYDKVAEKIGTPAAAFISFTIKTYYGTMRSSELKAMVKTYKNNPVILRLINARVRNYVYNHELSHERLAEFGSITGMKLLDTPATVIAKRNLGK